MENTFNIVYFLMKISKQILIVLLGIILFPANCISPFEPLGLKNTDGILVVEGMILETGTTIKLSHTVKLTERLNTVPLSNYVSDAHIQVIDEAGNTVAIAEPQIIDGKINPGTYIIKDTIIFTPLQKYALTIQIGVKQYQSAFVTPIRTPEIDEVNWILNDDLSLEIMVSTHDSENEIRYVRWSFEEDWEIRSPLFASYRFDQSSIEIVEQNLYSPNNRYYCWDSDVSKSILLGSADKLTEASFNNKTIHKIAAHDTRLSYLYSILVKQYGLNKEAFTYFENIKNNLENSGSIFGPLPTEKPGNIQCLSNPDEMVIGYITVSKETTSRIFINVSTLMILPQYFCDPESISVSEMPMVYRNGGGIYQYDSRSDEFTYVPRKCVDCTELGGKKSKPNFWPNDHL